MTPVTSAGVNGVMPFTTDFAGDPSTTALSPEGLLFYCQSRLSALDTNIQQYFAEQKKANAAMQDASKLVEILRQGNWGTGQKGSDLIACDPAACQFHADEANDILALWKTTSDPAVKEKCAEAFRGVTGLDVNDFASRPVTADDIRLSATMEKIQPVTDVQRSSQVDAIKELQTNMSKSTELNMIQLQSLVSQRQLAVQLTTQLMQTMHETSKQVVGNIR